MPGAKILVVDDEQSILDLVSAYLRREGYEVYTALDGLSGLQTVRAFKPDLVVLDVMLPGMDGIEVLKEIKRRFPLVEVVMLTGHGTAETAVEGMKLGAYDYLLKPADFEELLGKLEAARNRKESQEERIRRAEAKLMVRRSGGLS